MTKCEPFLGTTNNREEAFSGIEVLNIVIKQDPYGYYGNKDHSREATYSKSNVPRYASCNNPRCQQGGVDLQRLVWFHPSGEYEYYCGGHEGTPKGRYKGDPCGNVFTIILEVEHSRGKADAAEAI